VIPGANKSKGFHTLQIVDSHAHLESEDFDADRAEMLARAKASGVEYILAIGSGGSGPDQLDAAINVAKDYDWIYATIGIHPQHAQLAQEVHYAELAHLAKNPKVIAWGEIGLDYYWKELPRESQHTVFRRQLIQAREAKLPIVIHCRDAWDDCLKILKEDWAPSGLGGILHCFTGTPADAAKGIEMGFMISFAANVTYPKMQHLRDVARDLPLESLLTETDSPFLPPQGQRGKRNEPANVAEVAQTLASVRNLGTEEIAATTAANFRRFFRLGAS
jgi:TatD DNase family protein